MPLLLNLTAVGEGSKKWWRTLETVPRQAVSGVCGTQPAAISYLALAATGCQAAAYSTTSWWPRLSSAPLKSVIPLIQLLTPVHKGALQILLCGFCP